jgi:plastocyanin
MRLVKALAAALIVLGSLAVAAPAVVAGDPCYHGFELPTRSEGTDPQIKLMPCAFAPTVVRVAPGTTVTWFNGPDFTHLITGADQEWGDRDVEVQPGKQVSYRFDKAGVYPYACALHRGMSGTIIVGDVRTAAAAGSAPVPASQAKTTTDQAAPGSPTSAASNQPAIGPLVATAAGGAVVGGLAVLAGVWLLRARSDRDPLGIAGSTPSSRSTD